MADSAAGGVLPWHPHPGAFDLVAIPEEEIATKQLEFLHVSDAVRGPFADMKAKWHGLRQRLRGLTESEVLCREHQATISILRLYRPPGGNAAVSYRKSVSIGRAAAFTIFGVGFGAGGSTDLSSALNFTADETNLEMLLHLPVTAVRHLNPRTGVSLLRIDLGGQNQSVSYELRSFDEPPPKFDLDDYDRLEWQVLKRILLAESKASEMVTWTYPDVAREAYWHGKLDASPLPLSTASIKVEIKCRRADAYSAKFSLPHGKNYVFFSPAGETVIAPLCASLTPSEP